MPSVAERELNQHADLVFDILDARAYARAKAAYDRAGEMDEADRRRLMADPLVQQVKANDFELPREQMAERARRAADV